MRVWIVSGLIVVVAVTAYLVATGGDQPKSKSPKGPPAPSALTEREVRTYLTVWPQLNTALMRVADDVLKEHLRGNPDSKTAGDAGQAAADAIFAEHHLTRAGWKILSDRVEYAVECLRWDEDAERRNTELDRKIQQKEELLELATGRARTLLQEDIEALERQRAYRPPLSPPDVALVKSFWTDLSRHVPRRGQPQKRE